MFRRFSVNFAVLSIIIDAALIVLALAAAALLRAPLNFLPFLNKIEPVKLPPALYAAFPLMWVGVLLLFDVYDGRKNLRVTSELGSLALGSLLAVVSLAGLLYFSYRDISRFLFLMTAGLGLALLVSWRLVARLIFRKHGLHAQVRRVLILGAGPIGKQVEKQIRGYPALGLELVGYLEDDPAKKGNGLEILGTLDRTREMVLDRTIDDVVFALPAEETRRMTDIACLLHDLPVHVWVIPDYFALALHQARVDEFGGIPMLDLRAPALSDYQRITKRMFDIVVTLLVMPFALPLMALTSLAVRLDSPGPILYRTRRAGENGRVFRMFKFRTMVDGADQMLGQVMHCDARGVVNHKKPGDPRVTRVGRMLRRTSLDELPQLFNVLKGDMSLIGPRPELPELVERYSLWQRERFSVPQGMTGWWQVNGRSSRPLHLNTNDDLYYINNYSIWLDLKILFKTIWTVLRGKGAF